MSEIYEKSKKIALELIEKAALKSGSLVVVGCSSSEVIGQKIGTAGSVETAEDIVKGLKEVFDAKGINMCAQCCEHLNRALIIEADVAEKKGYEVVAVVPHPHAGGSFATAFYAACKAPVAVEEVRADAGIDIGLTLIGMHLKRVAVPLRFENNTLGEALITGAKVRPKFIGGERAKYC